LQRKRLRHPTPGYETSFNPLTTAKFHLPGGAEMEGVPANEFYCYAQGTNALMPKVNKILG
jgi:hypothetical protein